MPEQRDKKPVECPKCAFENPPENTRFCGRCGTQFDSTGDSSLSFTRTIETPIETLARGSVFADRYEVLEILGTGGMGEVYRVVDKKLEEEVALKLLRPEIASDTKTKERFRNEIKIARKIGHRNVCRMFDFNEENGKPYITMEYVPGEDLKGLIRRTGQLVIGTSISIAKQVCEGLKEAHRLGVVHRDLKPQNIMIDKAGDAKIMDFGIARSLESQGVTREGVIIGTPEYMSPEQVEGKPADHRADIYSLGVILYELVTGNTPFEGETALSIAHKHKYEEPLPPIKFNPQITEDLNRLILVCMSKQREDRYDSVEELLSDLTRLEEGIPTGERISPKIKAITSKEITLQFRLKKILIPAMLVIIFVAAAVVFLPKLQQKETATVSSDKPSLAVLYFKNNTGDQSLDRWRVGLADMLTNDLFQSKYLNVLSRNRVYEILESFDLLAAEEYTTEDLEKIAFQGGINHILVGTFIKAGDSWRISLNIQNTTTGETMGIEPIQGETEADIFNMVDKLTLAVKPYFNLSETQIRDDFDESIGSITTQVPEAMKYFVEGERYRRFGNTEKTLEYMEKAITADPNFAMAYRAAAGRYEFLGNFKKYREYNKKALELKDRLSERERLLLVSEHGQTYDERKTSYEKLLERYPDDIELKHSYANQLRNWWEYERAAELFEELIHQNMHFIFAFGNGVQNYCSINEYEKAIEIKKLWNKNNDKKYCLADILILQGKYEEAQSEIEQFDFKYSFHNELEHKPMLLGDIHHLNGRWAQAEEQYSKVFELEDKIPHFSVLLKLAGLHLTTGRFDKARETLQKGIELAVSQNQPDHQSTIQGELRNIYIYCGDSEQALKDLRDSGSANVWSETPILIQLELLEQAKQNLTEIEKSVEATPTNRYKFHAHWRKGLYYTAIKEFPQAIEELESAVALMPGQYWNLRYSHFRKQALVINYLATAYSGSGDLSNAEQQYLRITELTVGRLFSGHVYAQAFYNLGKIYQHKDWKGKAIENYRKFIEIWKDADPQFQPLLDDAKQQVALLERN